MTGYCASCGERKRLTYPRSRYYGLAVCSQRCAARGFMRAYEVGATGWCIDCGEVTGADHVCDGGEA